MPALKQCFIPYCNAVIPRHLLMCRRHWNRVPADLQADVYSTCRAMDADLRAYLIAANKAALAVVEAESDRTDLVIATERRLRAKIARLSLEVQ